MRELFIYYRVPADAVSLARTQVEALQRALGAEIPNLRARLLRRPEPDPAGQTTFMETYAIAPPSSAGIDADLQARIEAAAAAALGALGGARHVEVFVACTEG